MLQETSPSPTATAPALAPAAPPAQGTPTVVTPGGPLELQGLPRSAEEVQGLHARRDLLRDQLNRATNRRSELVAQLNREPVPEARAGLQQRLNALDERILEIERDQATTERLLSNTAPEVLALTVEPEYRGGQMDEDDAIAMGFATFGLGIVVAMLVGRFRRRRFRRAAAVAAQALPNDPRYDQLMQAVEAISEEVERIGEGQRFVTQLLSNRRETQPLAIESDLR